MSISTPEPPKQRPRKVGFYACGRIVRVKLRDPEATHYPRTFSVHCPACGYDHTVHLSWRVQIPRLDDGKEALLLDAT